MARIDLHLHSIYSDGEFRPCEVVKFGHQKGTTALSLTDHDTVGGIPEALQTGQDLGIDIIPGIELSAYSENREIHILGYYIDWTDPRLDARLQVLRQSRHTRNREILTRLQELQFPLTYEEVKAVAGRDSVGRPHIAHLLVQKGYAANLQDAFRTFLGEGALAFVPRHLPQAREVIEWIREAGGVAVLAHPCCIKRKKEELFKYCETLRAEGLQGIEVFYSAHTPKDIRDYLEIARKLNLLVTGGSDFHGSIKPGIAVGVGRGGLKIPQTLLAPLRKAAGQDR